ncbi:hypothetical protein [Novosphingobium aquae]|uniref:Oligosaccharide repeat unit polymerase n=1 Tax=Novosphingobium aquae TaxID=3133435 RepID=A0ABU8SDV1_9SPHN
MIEPDFPLAFYGLCLILSGIAVHGIVRGRTIFAYPTLAALIGLAWVVPQGIELSNRTNFYSGEGFWLYVGGCFLAIPLGFWFAFKKERKRLASRGLRDLPSFSNERLLVAAAGMVLIGMLAQFEMRGIDTSSMGGEWTGVITAWYLLGKSSGLGLCLSVLVFARTRKPAALALAVIAAIPVAQAAIFGVRREDLFDLLVLSIGAWYLAKHKAPPKLAVIVGALLGTVILNSADDFRSRIIVGNESFLEVILSRETYDNFHYTNLGQGAASEVGQAQFDFYYANQKSDWELGAEYWNSLVSQYFPAFIFGREAKEGFKFNTLEQRLRTGEEKGLLSRGSTRTGFSDSYRALGVFGIMIFWVISVGFGFLFARAWSDSINSQYLYLVLLAEGIKVITHSTASLIAAFPFVVGIYIVAFKFAERPPSRRKLRPSRPLLEAQ